MNLFWLLVLLGVLLAAGLSLNIVLVRYLAILWHVPDATWLKATRVVLLITVANILGYALLLAMTVAEARWKILSQGMLVPAAVMIMIVVSAVAPIWAFVVGLQTTLRKAIGLFVSLLIMSTLVGYGLAFAFRTTLAEAFVVPSGAMAPTILGQHVRLRCPNCAHEADVGASAAMLAYRGWPAVARHGYDCLQCGEQGIKLDDDPQLRSGDRVLVDKTDRTPQRFDVVVFRYIPEEGWMPENIPLRPQSWVMRCVGLPGEEVAIVDGDLFIEGRRLQKGPHELEDLWLEVHDTELTPQRAAVDRLMWQTGDTTGGWQWKKGRWSVDADAAALAELSFAGEQADYYAYDFPEDRHWGKPALVRDWRITVDVAQWQGDGAIGFFWRDGERATCMAVNRRGTVQVFANREQFAAAAFDNRGDDVSSIAGVSPIAFAVRDGKAYLSIDGKVLATADLASAHLEEVRSLDAARDRDARVQFGIVARDVRAQLSRIRVDRDVHYRTRREMDANQIDNEPDVWRLEREYFFLGDHSPQSQDCRFIGPIDEQEIIGVARWCYWPLERMREFTGR